jgi:DNA ligase (NAD+)
LELLQWGDSLIDKLCESGKVNSVVDLYKLPIEDLAKCCSSEKVAKKCHKILHSKKDIPLELFLASLNIPNLGISTAIDIVRNGFDTVEAVVNMSVDDLLNTPNIGKITAQNLYESFQERRELILDLNSVLNVKSPKKGRLSNISVCITGVTSKPRREIEQMILEAGGIVKHSVGKDTTYLITNDSGTQSTKMQKAQKYGVKVISENYFYDLLTH